MFTGDIGMALFAVTDGLLQMRNGFLDMLGRFIMMLRGQLRVLQSFFGMFDYLLRMPILSVGKSLCRMEVVSVSDPPLKVNAPVINAAIN